VLDGSAELDYARAAGVPEDKLRIVDSQMSLFRDVVAGRAGAGALTAISLADELRRNPGSGVDITRPVEPTVEGRTVIPGAAFAVRLGDDDLLAAFDAGLTALQESGEWLRIVEPFGLSADNLPDPDLTTTQLCEPT
jgi:polar amino acid transport system substrate-binding protein